MSVGKIISHVGNGLYVVELVFRDDRILDKRQFYQKTIDRLNSEYAVYQIEHDNLVTLLNEQKSIVDTLFNTIFTDQNERKNKITEAIKNRNETISKIIGNEGSQSSNREVWLDSVNKKKLYDDYSNTVYRKELWCVEYRLDLIIRDDNGNAVETFVDIVDNRDEYTGFQHHQYIRPVVGRTEAELAYNLRIAKKNEQREILYTEPALNSEKWTTTYNWMAMPPFQKWLPRYRRAVITSIDYANNTCRVSLQNYSPFSSVETFTVVTNDDVTVNKYGNWSNARKLNIENSVTIDNVKIEYGYCDAYKFKPNDKVVLYWNDALKFGPKVIGFQSNPVKCADNWIVYYYNNTIYTRRMTTKGVFPDAISPDINYVDDRKTLQPITSVFPYGMAVTNNYGGSPRQNYCIVEQKDNEGNVTQTDHYTFEKYKLYKNGIELNWFDFAGYQLFPGFSRPPAQGFGVPFAAGLNILAVDHYNGTIYVLCWTELIKEESALFPSPVVVEQQDGTFRNDVIDYKVDVNDPDGITVYSGSTGGPGFRILQFSTTGSIQQAFDVNIFRKIPIYYPNGLKTKEEDRIYYFNNWTPQSITEKIPTVDSTDPVTLFRGIRIKTNIVYADKLHALYIRGFSIGEEGIFISSSHGSPLANDDLVVSTSSLMLINKTSGEIISHVFKNISPLQNGSTFHNGDMLAVENKEDGYSDQGKIPIVGILNAPYNRLVNPKYDSFSAN